MLNGLPRVGLFVIRFENLGLCVRLGFRASRELVALQRLDAPVKRADGRPPPPQLIAQHRQHPRGLVQCPRRHGELATGQPAPVIVGHCFIAQAVKRVAQLRTHVHILLAVASNGKRDAHAVALHVLPAHRVYDPSPQGCFRHRLPLSFHCKTEPPPAQITR